MLKTFILHPSVSKNNALEPFFQLISVHLCCAMTHIVEKIQYSSLKLLDLLIDLKPDFVRAFAPKILENFIEQISKGDPNRANRRVLKNDPLKFTSTHSWRKNVLTRLSKMLAIVLLGQGRSEESVVEKKSVLRDCGESRECLLVVNFEYV